MANAMANDMVASGMLPGIEMVHELMKHGVAGCEHPRPHTLQPGFDRIYTENHANGFKRARGGDRWVNSGGKNCQVSYTVRGGTEILRRKGRVVPRDQESSALPPQVFFQYTLAGSPAAATQLVADRLFVLVPAARPLQKRSPSQKPSQKPSHKRKMPSSGAVEPGGTRKRCRPASTALATVLVFVAQLMLLDLFLVDREPKHAVQTVDVKQCPAQMYKGAGLGSCFPCTRRCPDNTVQISNCSQSSDTVCSRGWLWAPQVAQLDASWEVGRTFHLPQFAASWQTRTSLFVLGGASSAYGASQTERSAVGQCHADEIGVPSQAATLPLWLKITAITARLLCESLTVSDGVE
jgi:hypothetical protein